MDGGEAWIRQDVHFSWLPDEAFPILNACFDLETEALSAGSCRETAGRMGYLLQGTGTVNGAPLNPGELFGVCRTGQGEKQAVSGVFRAESDCRIFWIQVDAVNRACYRGCWFHARLIQELDALIP